MRAFVIRSAHEATIEELPQPEPQVGEALVRVLSCGVCGSDLHAFEGSQPFFQYPEIPGHEVVGEIVALAPRPEGPMRLTGRPIEEALGVGERVVLDPAMPCGRCYPCTHGRYNCCENMRVIGVHAPGALADYYVAPAECLHRVPASMSDELAALVEPLSIGVHANRRARIVAEDTALVIGAGTIGLCVMMVAKSAGAKVAMTDLSQARREKAVGMGADLALDPREAGFEDALREFCGGTGPSVVVEAVGTSGTAAQALELAAASGRVLLLGLISGDLTIPGNIMVRKELDFLGSRLHGGTVPEAIRLVSEGCVDVSGLVTHRVELSESRDPLELMGRAPDEILKAVARVAGT